MKLNIHQKINARSWYEGEVHPTSLMAAGKENGLDVYTPARIRIHAPYEVGFLGFAVPRFKQQFYLIPSI